MFRSNVLPPHILWFNERAKQETNQQEPGRQLAAATTTTSSKSGCACLELLLHACLAYLFIYSSALKMGRQHTFLNRKKNKSVDFQQTSLSSHIPEAAAADNNGIWLCSKTLFLHPTENNNP